MLFGVVQFLRTKRAPGQLICYPGAHHFSTMTSFCVYTDVALRGFHLFGPCQRYSVSNQTSLSNGERPHYVLPEALSPKQHTHVLRRTVYLQISLTIQNRLLNPFFQFYSVIELLFLYARVIHALRRFKTNPVVWCSPRLSGYQARTLWVIPPQEASIAGTTRQRRFFGSLRYTANGRCDVRRFMNKVSLAQKPPQYGYRHNGDSVVRIPERWHPFYSPGWIYAKRCQGANAYWDFPFFALCSGPLPNICVRGRYVFVYCSEV